MSEPSAEVIEAAARAMYEAVWPDADEIRWSLTRNEYTRAARAALNAAGAAVEREPNLVAKEVPDLDNAIAELPKAIEAWKAYRPLAWRQSKAAREAKLHLFAVMDRLAGSGVATDA